jgi:hypothetical protein
MQPGCFPIFFPFPVEPRLAGVLLWIAPIPAPIVPGGDIASQ